MQRQFSVGAGLGEIVTWKVSVAVAPAARLGIVHETVVPVTVAGWLKPVGAVSSGGSASSTVTLVTATLELLVTESDTVACGLPVRPWKLT